MYRYVWSVIYTFLKIDWIIYWDYMTCYEGPIGSRNYGSAIWTGMSSDRRWKYFKFLCPNAGIINMVSLPSELFKSLQKFNFTH